MTNGRRFGSGTAVRSLSVIRSHSIIRSEPTNRRRGKLVDWAAKLKRELMRPFARTAPSQVPLDFSPFQRQLLKKVRPYTMTSDQRVAVLEAGVRHVAAHYAGDFVECGVAKG